MSFGTPYRMGAHSTPAVGLLKRATSRAAKERAVQQEQQEQQERMYPPLPIPPPSSTSTGTTKAAADEEGVMTKASKFISRLSGSFGGLLASPKPSHTEVSAIRTAGDKGKRKATDVELEPSPRIARRRVDDSIEADLTASTDTSRGETTVDSLLSLNDGRVRSTINASMYTNATTVFPDEASTRKPTATRTQPRIAAASASTSRGAGVRATGSGGRVGFTSSRQLAGGSSGVSHTPLSLLSPATHRVAARKVDELRQSRAERNWTSPRRQRLALQHSSTNPHTTGSTSTVSGSRRPTTSSAAAKGRSRAVAPSVGANTSSGNDSSGRDGSIRNSSDEESSVSLADIVTSAAARSAVLQKRGGSGVRDAAAAAAAAATVGIQGRRRQ